VTYQDLEITNTNTTRGIGRPTGVSTSFGVGDSVTPEGNQFINNIVHDVGIAFLTFPGTDVAYGNVIYNCGNQDVGSRSGHGFYSENGTPGGDVGTNFLVRNNLILNSFGYGFHIFADHDAGYDIKNITVDKNIIVQPGELSSTPSNTNPF